jgi:hypothetical protein
MAVHSLAVGPEDIRGRLPRVYRLLADLSSTDFPEPLQADFEWVMSELTARKPTVDGTGIWGDSRASKRSCDAEQNRCKDS